MSTLKRLGPGGPVPDWVRALEAEVFDEAWGDLAPHECLWMVPEVAYARWSVVPAAEEAELLRIAVAPEGRGRGLGRWLLRACQRDLEAEGIRDMRLEVRASNGAAQALYRACGWREAGRRRRYYRDGEDAVLFGRRP